MQPTHLDAAKKIPALVCLNYLNFLALRLQGNFFPLSIEVLLGFANASTLFTKIKFHSKIFTTLYYWVCLQLKIMNIFMYYLGVVMRFSFFSPSFNSLVLTH